MLKSIKSEISEAIAIIINQSILTGIFPDQLKLAKVKPLYKKGEKCCLDNYRPISLLPTISKIFERVMYKQLYQYFNKNKLLYEQQYGFRSQHSTELAAVKLVDYVIKEMDSNKKVNTPVTLFLDISEAFETLTFDILLKKLKHYRCDVSPFDLYILSGFADQLSCLVIFSLPFFGNHNLLFNRVNVLLTYIITGFKSAE